MTTAMQIGETARDRADFCRCFKTGAAVFLHDDGVVAHSTYRNTLRAAYMLARTNRDTRGCKPFGIRMRWQCTPVMLAPGRLMLATSPTPDRVEPCHEGDRNRCPVEAGYRQEIVAAPGAHLSGFGPSRHFAAAQQPRRFRSKADINFDAFRHRVYEYTA